MKAIQTKTQTNTQAAPQSARQAGKTAPFFKKGPVKVRKPFFLYKPN
jgi:hypothetical protein